MKYILIDGYNYGPDDQEQWINALENSGLPIPPTLKSDWDKMIEDGDMVDLQDPMAPLHLLIMPLYKKLGYEILFIDDAELGDIYIAVFSKK